MNIKLRESKEPTNQHPWALHEAHRMTQPTGEYTSHRASPENPFLARKGELRLWEYEWRSPTQGPELPLPQPPLSLGRRENLRLEGLKGRNTRSESPWWDGYLLYTTSSPLGSLPTPATAVETIFPGATRRCPATCHLLSAQGCFWGLLSSHPLATKDWES